MSPLHFYLTLYFGLGFCWAIFQSIHPGGRKLLERIAGRGRPVYGGRWLLLCLVWMACWPPQAILAAVLWFGWIRKKK